MKTNLQKRVENSTQLNGVKRSIKLLGILMVAVMTTFTACTDYDNSLNNAEDRLDNVEQKIPTIGEQIESINNSINNLKELKTDLNSLSNRVKDLEDEDDKINKFIEGLRTADETLSKNIEDLQTYVNGKFKEGIEGWVNTTFATLDQYENLQRTIIEISGLIDKYKSDITEAYTKDIEEAIATSEESMKGWVNELLAEGYYNTSEVDAKLSTLETTDANLQEQINAQQQALEQAKEELTKAYEEAIKDVIENNNGIITEAIASAVQSVIDSVNTELQAIKDDISEIQKEIANIKNKINSIDEQIEGINKSINELKATDIAINTFIDALENLINENALADATTKSELEGLIDQLEEKDTELNQKITDLQNYVDQDFKEGVEEWANTTFATLEQYQSLQTTIAEIRTLIDTYKNEITEAYTKAIEDAIDASEESMKGWVNELLAEGYYNTSEVDAKLSTLETTDANLQEQINAQQQALEQAKEELTKAYEEAIKDVIENNNGIITEAIDSAVQSVINSVNTELQAIRNDIIAIQDEIANLKNKINSIDKQIVSINNSISRLEEADKTLDGYIDNLRKKVTDLQNQIDANNDNDVETKKELNNIKSLINTLEAKDIELDKKIADLKTYVDNEIASTKNWANATFATLEQYQTLQTTIAEIRTLIDTYKNEITEAYTKAIKDAIDASEESMKGWVNELLAEGYYNIADIDAKLSTLETADANLQEQINAQQQALEQTKEELTSAYQSAINEAIEANNGVIDQRVSAAIQEAINAVNTQITTINNTIANIQEEIENIKNSISYIEEQIESITGLIDELDNKLSNLETTDTDIINQINEQKQALEQMRTDLTSAYEEAIKRAIEENNGVINTEIAEAVQAAMDKVENRLNTLRGTIESIEEEIENIKNSISSIEEQIESITGLIDELDNKLSNLETTDTDIINQINEQKQALEQMRTDLTNAYEAAIKRAIEENNGVINAEIAEAIQEVLTEVENRLDNLRGTIDNIENELTTLKENFASRIQSIRFLPEYNDGMVMFSTSETTADVSFIISPSNLATVIANAHSDATPVVTAWISRTQSTRAVDMPVALTVTSVEGSDSGLLIVGVDISSLADGYWDSFQSANMFIRIQDGNNDVISEMIPVGFENE